MMARLRPRVLCAVLSSWVWCVLPTASRASAGARAGVGLVVPHGGWMVLSNSRSWLNANFRNWTRLGTSNCALAPPRSSWADANATCARQGWSLPVVRTPQQNEELRTLLAAAGDVDGASALAAWLGLYDSGSGRESTSGGGWAWVDGNRCGRAPSGLGRVEQPVLANFDPPPRVADGGVPYYPGFHNWDTASVGSGHCASLDGRTGRWAAEPCGQSQRHAVVCCEPPPPSLFMGCSEGAGENSAEWPIMPFLYV